MAVDSQWGNTSLLLPLSANLLDARGHTMTASGGIALSSAVGTPFGAGNALFCDGSTDLLTADSSDFTMGTGDFSIQFAFYPVAPGGHGAAYARLLTIGENATGNGLYITSNASDNPMTLLIQYYVSGYLNVIDYVATTISNDAWHWLQLDRVSGVWSCYVDGTLYSTKSTSVNLTRTKLCIGANSAGGEAFKGYFSNVRVTKGAYRASHAVPSAPFPRPSISGVTKNANTGVLESKVVVALKRSTLAVDGTAVSAGDGTYTIYPSDFSEHVVMDFDTATYPLVDGGSGENAIIYDRVIPG